VGQLAGLAAGEPIEPEALDATLAELTLALGADGVMVRCALRRARPRAKPVGRK
jgi:hypothetical protein